MQLRKPLLSALATCLLGAGLIGNTLAAPNDAETLGKIRDAAMQDDWAYQRLEDLTDLVGPRLSGSAGAAAAVEQVADAMRKLGAKVTLQPVKVPHWVRGEEKGEIVDYKGRPANVTQKVVLTALGGSGATPANGLHIGRDHDGLGRGRAAPHPRRHRSGRVKRLHRHRFVQLDDLEGVEADFVDQLRIFERFVGVEDP